MLALQRAEDSLTLFLHPNLRKSQLKEMRGTQCPGAHESASCPGCHLPGFGTGWTDKAASSSPGTGSGSNFSSRAQNCPCRRSFNTWLFPDPGDRRPRVRKGPPHTSLHRGPWGSQRLSGVVPGSKCPSYCQEQTSPCLPREGLAGLKVQGWQGGDCLKDQGQSPAGLPCEGRRGRAAGGSPTTKAAGASHPHPQGCRRLLPAP